MQQDQKNNRNMEHLDPDLLIRSALERGLIEEAGPAIDDLIAANPSHPEGWFLKGVHGLLTGDWTNASTWFEEALDRGADRRATCLGRGQALLGANRPREAWNTLAELADRQPGDAEVLHWLLRAATALEKWEEIVPRLESYLRERPDDHAARFALAGVSLRLGRTAEARVHHEILLRLQPDLEGLDELSFLLEPKLAATAA